MLFSKLTLIVVGLLNALQLQSSIPERSSDWELTQNWQFQKDSYVFQAGSYEIVRKCQESPADFIEFPNVIHGYQEVYLDSRLIFRTGHPNFERVHSVYGSGNLECFLLKDGSHLEWKVYSPSRLFSRVASYPILSHGVSSANLLTESLYILTIGALLSIGLFCWCIFKGRISDTIVFSLVMMSVCFSVYLACAVAGLVGLNISSLTAHRVGDIGLFLGIAFLGHSLQISEYAGRRLRRFVIVNMSVVVILLILSTDMDRVVLATLLGIPGPLVMLAYAIFRGIQKMIQDGARRKITFQVISLILLFVATANDGLHVYGIIRSIMIAPLGMIGCLIFFALSIHEVAKDAYMERDHLRENLEMEVEKKTQELLEKSAALESAEKIRLTREAELGQVAVQVAHDIRSPLSTLSFLVKSLPELSSDKSDLFQQALSRLNSIANQLLNRYRNSNQKEANQAIFKIGEAIRLIQRLVREKNFHLVDQDRNEKSQKIEVICELTGGLENLLNQSSEVDTTQIQLDSTVFEQVISNLITNAVESIEQSGHVKISLQLKENSMQIQIADSGKGIPADILPKLCTKGATFNKEGGTGLGLYHAKTTIESVGGTFTIASKVGEGTSIEISLPLRKSVHDI